MATIVILEHAFQDQLGVPYMLHAIAGHWSAQGHRVLFHRGEVDPPPGDLAVLHVDLTVTPAAYRRLLAFYPRVVNAAVLDISKRLYSRDAVGPGSDWPGPVILKSEGNFGGRIDMHLRALEMRAHGTSAIPELQALKDYPVFNSAAGVPAAHRNLPGLFVEKFLPEQDARGYYLRIWSFFGDRERSSRFRSSEPIIKARNIADREAVEVPDEIRAWRAKLGFDFGKFDYVRHGDRYALLDANRTPGMPPTLAASPGMRATLALLAEGLGAFLR